jgi:hypothetical protein
MKYKTIGYFFIGLAFLSLWPTIEFCHATYYPESSEGPNFAGIGFIFWIGMILVLAIGGYSLIKDPKKPKD